MAITKRAPPSPPKTHFDRHKNRRLYTIHSRANLTVPFSVVLNENNAEIKTSVVAFADFDEALVFATSLEGHYISTHEWPHTNFDQAPSFQLANMNYNVGPDEMELFKLSIVSWEKHAMKSFCYEKLVDLLILSEVVNMPYENLYKGTLFKTYVNHDDTVAMLTNTYL